MRFKTTKKLLLYLSTNRIDWSEILQNENRLHGLNIGDHIIFGVIKFTRTSENNCKVDLL